MRDTAIRNIYQDTVTINNETEVFDKDGNFIVIDEEKINKEIARLQTEYKANEYQRQRQREYPSFADQFDLLYHGGYDAWKAEIDKIKNKYPKVNNAN